MELPKFTISLAETSDGQPSLAAHVGGVLVANVQLEENACDGNEFIAAVAAGRAQILEALRGERKPRKSGEQKRSRKSKTTEA